MGKITGGKSQASKKKAIKKKATKKKVAVKKKRATKKKAVAKRPNHRPPAILETALNSQSYEEVWQKIDSMLMKGVEGTTIAYRLGVHPDTFYAFGISQKRWGDKIKGIATFSAYKTKKRELGYDSLRERQFDTAMGIFGKDENGQKVLLKEPNVSMQIWLGKNLLGQSDKTDITSGDEPIASAPVTLQISTNLREDKLKK